MRCLVVCHHVIFDQPFVNHYLVGFNNATLVDKISLNIHLTEAASKQQFYYKRHFIIFGDTQYSKLELVKLIHFRMKSSETQYYVDNL